MLCEITSINEHFSVMLRRLYFRPDDAPDLDKAYLGGVMELLGELFIEIVGAISEVIGEELAKSINDDLQNKHPNRHLIKWSLLAIIAGLLCSAVIFGLGFATYILFASSHPFACCIVAIVTFFFLILFVSVITKLNRIKRKK